MENYYFISYSKVDGVDFARRLADGLIATPPAIPVWLDERELQPGQPWDEQIVRALQQCAGLILVMTVDSVHGRSECKHEWSRALRYKKPVIPLLAVPAAEVPYRLESRQYVDFTGGYSAALAELRTHLRWLPSPEGLLHQLEDRLAEAERDLPRASDGERVRIQDEMTELRRTIAAQRQAMAHPQIATRKTELRIDSGLQRVRAPVEPIHGETQTKFINPPPTRAPTWFQGRQVETSQVGAFLKEPGRRLMTVVGRGGVGKTAMVCRLLKSVESGHLPDEGGPLRVDGIVYLSPKSLRQVNLGHLFHDLCKLLPSAQAELLEEVYRNAHLGVAAKMQRLLAAFAGGCTVALLDAFEEVVDPASGELLDRELHEALRALLEVPEHGVKILITTRVAPKPLQLVQPGRQTLLELDQGLASPFAENLLRAMDAGGTIGLRDAPDALLARARRRTLGYPRALEALHGILAADRSTTVEEVLEEAEQVLPQDLVGVLVGEAFSRLDSRAQQVLQALAILAAPCPETAVDFVLQPYVPDIDSGPILRQLVSMLFARCEGGRFHLHQVDQRYALERVPRGEPSDREAEPLPFTRYALLHRAAEYFEQSLTPRQSGKSITNAARPLASCYIACSAGEIDYAEALKETLVAAGYGVILYRNVEEEVENFAVRIHEGLELANVVILLATRNGLRSTWLQHELLLARDLGKPILPIAFTELYFDFIPVWLRDIQSLREQDAVLSAGPTEHVIDAVLRAIPSLLANAKPVRSRSIVEAPPADEAPSFPQPATDRPLNEGKMILVGRGEVGKTSLVRRLVLNEFSGDEAKTPGISITEWKVKVGTDRVRLRIWDFGGQEIMHATHQFFLTDQSLYLLVLNGREGGEDSDAEYWLKHVQSFGGESPVIVVQNKVVQHPFELNYRGLQARYPQIRAFVKTDCAEGVGLSDLAAKIRDAIEQMPEFRMRIPANWYRVKTSLEAMRTEFVRYDDFRRLCGSEGIAGEGDLELLSWLLHRLGVALNYRNDLRLRETSVLRPEWVTEGIYQIINARTLADRRGELTMNDLSEILPSDRYPEDKHAFLVELMRKFSLCFAFPDSSNRYLVPDLLGKEEPEELVHFTPGNCLNFEYHYEILPDFVIPRFIVRSHPLSQATRRWRSGVILMREQSLALVTSHPADRRVLVRVRGGSSTMRRELLAVIRYDIDRINNDFRDGLGAKAMVPLFEHPSHAVDYEKLKAFESRGILHFHEYFAGEVATVDVRAHLDGIDVKAEVQSRNAAPGWAPVVFFSYAHEDEPLRDELETHLKLLQRQKVISLWHDRKILPGSEWDHEIARELESASLILLLVSSDLLASDYCYEKEVARALERQRLGQAKVVPILLRPCDWESAPFAKLQGLPGDMRAVTEWPSRDAAWTAVAKGIRALANEAISP